MAISHQILGSELQVIEITLNPGESVCATPGALVSLDAGIEMQTTTGSSILQGLKRLIGGSDFFISTFTQQGTQKSKVSFASHYPGKIIALKISEPDGDMLCQKDAFLCAESTIQFDIAFTKRLGTGFFGGEGFILQRLHGQGEAFIHAGGTVVKRELAAGEELRVAIGCLVAFTRTIDFDTQFVGGFRNVLFGGEGLFFARLKGPGTVYLQSLPFSRLAESIMSSSFARNRLNNKK